MADKKKTLKLFTSIVALPGTIDRFNGITISSDTIKDDLLQPENFRSRLTNSVEAYKTQGFRGVWLKLTSA